MDESPLTRLLEAVDSRDVEGVVRLFAPDVRLALMDGRQAQGIEDARRLLAEVLAALRSVEHEISRQWHEGDVWFGEGSATYELQDWFKMRARRRALVVQAGAEGITGVRAYGAHEAPIDEHGQDEGLIRIGGRVLPPL